MKTRSFFFWSFLAVLLAFCGWTTCANAQYGGYQRKSFQTYYQGYPQVYYYVGAPIRQEAMVQAQMAADPDYQAFLQFKQFKSEFEAFRQYQEQAQQQQAQQQLPVQQSQLATSCLRCHSGPEPKGGRDLSGSIFTDDLKAIQEQLQQGLMPPENSPERQNFDAGAAGQVLVDAINQLETTDVLPQRAPPQPPPRPAPPPVESEL